MNSAASRRALSSLASKIHPQLPLSPRECQQLLNLLTTSFRAHLDREHPTATPEARGEAQLQNGQAKRGTAPHASSYSLATQHMDSILSNPLFARKPRRRASDAAALDMLKDPLAWFLDEIAAGTADISAAASCLRVLGTQPEKGNDKRPGLIIAEWLHSSGLEKSKDFINSIRSQPYLLHTLVPLLLAENNQAPLWRWLLRHPVKRVNETTLNALDIRSFRVELLQRMVMCAQSTSRDEAFRIFLRAYGLLNADHVGLAPENLRRAGASLVNDIVANPVVPCSPGLYEAFLASTTVWLDDKTRSAVRPMLLLHHPTKPSFQPALSFIQDPQGAIRHVGSKSAAKRNFLVELCLSVARKLLEEERFTEIQTVMAFIQDHFAEAVIIKHPSNTPLSWARREREKQEKENLDMLDGLLPT